MSVNQVEQASIPLRTKADPLPLRGALRRHSGVTLLIAGLTAVAALAGAFFPQAVYPTAAAEEAFRANDLVTLGLGLPALLLTVWQAQRGRLAALLFWPGALLYGLYNYLVYLFGAPVTAVYPLFVLIVTLSFYALVALAAAIDGAAVSERLRGQVAEKVGGGALTVLGLLFGLLALNVLGTAVLGQTPLPGPERGLVVADFLLAAAWMIGGVLLWRARPFGYVAGGALLFCGTLLFIGVTIIIILQALLAGTPVAVTDVLVLLGMGFVCYVPWGLFWRGVRHADG